MTAKYGVLCREIVIDSTNNQIVFTENGGSDLTATIAAGTYFLDDTSDSLLDAIITALNAVSVTYTFNSPVVNASPQLNLTTVVEDLWCAAWIFTTPGTTTTNNVVFRWSDAACTFDPKLIGADNNGSDFTWAAYAGSNTAFFSTHAPTPVFVPDFEVAEDDDTKNNADVVSHVSPNNVRTHYVVRDREKRKTLQWSMLTHDRVHRKDSSLSFTGEEWGCFDTFWESQTWKGGRLRYHRWDHTTSSVALGTSTFVDDYVFADSIPKDIPVMRRERSQRIYDVGPLLLSPYVTP